MAGYTPDHDWWPELANTIKITSEREALVRALQWQLIEWRLLADRTLDPDMRDALYRNLLAWQGLLDEHRPDSAGRCLVVGVGGAARCSGRVRSSPTWPSRCGALHN